MGGGAVVMFGGWKGSSAVKTGLVGSDELQRRGARASSSRRVGGRVSCEASRRELAGRGLAGLAHWTSRGAVLTLSSACLRLGGRRIMIVIGIAISFFFLLSSMLECGHAVFLLLTCSCLGATCRTVSRATYIPSPTPRSFNCQPPVVTDSQTAAWTA